MSSPWLKASSGVWCGLSDKYRALLWLEFVEFFAGYAGRYDMIFN